MLALTIGNPVYVISTNKGARRVWPVSAYPFAATDPSSGVSRGPCKPDFHCALFHVPDLGTDFDCRFFRLPDWTHLFLLRSVPFT
jgi:hypothetical protein